MEPGDSKARINMMECIPRCIQCSSQVCTLAREAMFCLNAVLLIQANQVYLDIMEPACNRFSNTSVNSCCTVDGFFSISVICANTHVDLARTKFYPVSGTWTYLVGFEPGIFHLNWRVPSSRLSLSYIVMHGKC